MALEVHSHPEVVSGIDLFAAWTEAQMAYKGQPGLSVGIVHDQALIWAKGFGFADVEEKKPATPATIYRIASITKLFTNTAILQLRDAGKLQLDDLVSQYLPWFTVQNPHPDSPSITIRHLLTHTSGLPRESAFPYWTDAVFPSREQVREALPQQSAVLPAETMWKYSNLALSLAGEIVATVSGSGFADYVQQQILEPLGMGSTYVLAPDPEHPHLATGYGRRLPDHSRSLSPFGDCKGITPAVNMSSSVEDLASFAMLQLRDGPAGGSQILRGSTLREMQRVHWLEPDWTAGWGLGFRIQRLGGKTYIGHGGALEGYRTLLMICPADKVAVIVLTNADDGEPLEYAEKVIEWVAPAISKAASPEPEPAVPDPAWQPYLGRYRDAWGDSQVLIQRGELTLIGPAAPDPVPAMSKLVPAGEHTFRMETKDGFGTHGEPLVFEVDDEGKVYRMKHGENDSYPVERW